MKYKHLLYAAVVLLWSACSETTVDNAPDIPSPQPENFPMQMISVQAGMAQEQAADSSAAMHTKYSNGRILWSDGDQLRLFSDQIVRTNHLQGTITANSVGMGIIVNQDGTAQVRYSNISIIETTTKTTGNGNNKQTQTQTRDITASVTQADPDTYKFGIYNAGRKYQYVPANTVMTAEINQNSGAYTIPLIQASSSLSLAGGTSYTVTLDNVEYSLDNGQTWLMPVSQTELRNPFGGKGAISAVSFSGNSTGVNTLLTLASGAGETHGTFSGSIPQGANPAENTTVVFPASNVSDIAAPRFSITLPAEQQYQEGSFGAEANPMLGHLYADDSNGYTTRMRNLCGAIRISLTGECTLSKITVTDKAGNKLWGKASLDATDYQADDAAISGIAADGLTGGTDVLTLECPGVMITQEPTDFYFVVPVGAFSQGLTVSVYTNDGRTQTYGTSADITISRNDICQLPSKALNKLMACVNVENEAVQQFMSYGPYNGFGATSYFTLHSAQLSENLCKGKDTPAGYTVSWSGNAGSYTVSCTDKTRNTTFTKTTSENQYEFYNLVPGHSYEYTVSDGSNILKQGLFKAEGQVRMVRLDDSWNYRDLGGWTGLGGKRVKYEWIYRGGSLNGKYNGSGYSCDNPGDPSLYTPSQNFVQQVEDLGIKAELDLRGITDEGEWGNQTDIHTRCLTANGSAYCNLQQHISDFRFRQIMTDRSLYFDRGTQQEKYAIVKDVEYIIDQVLDGRPVAFHCKSGADRTGAVGMIVLALLGVDPGDIARDYELTTLSHEKLETAGSLSFQRRLTTAVWSSSAGYKFFYSAFTGGTNDNWQQKAYNFLSDTSRNFGGEAYYIATGKLDRFISFMLE